MQWPRIRVVYWVAGLLLLGWGLAGCSWLDAPSTREPAKLLPINGALPVRIVWETDIGKGNPDHQAKFKLTHLDGRLLAADISGVVCALNPENGRILWTYHAKQALSAGVGAGEGLVVVATEQGQIVALAAESGALRWQINTNNEVLAIPQVRHDRVIVRTIDGEVLGLNATDGQVSWRYNSTVPLLSLRGTSTPILTESKVIIGQANGELAALDLQNGATLWKQTLAVSHSRSPLGGLVDIDAEMALSEGVIFATAFQGRVTALTEDSGTVLWNNDAVYGYTGLDADYRQVYITHLDEGVWALDRNNGVALWKQTQLSYRQLTAPVVMGEQVVVADFEGFVHWLDRQDGHLVARIRAHRKGIQATPLVVGEVLYTLGDQGQVTALTLQQMAKK